MKKKKCDKRLAACLLSVVAPTAPLAAVENEAAVGDGKQAPHIVLILADDLGYGDLSCYGANRIQTPTIDQMAEEGMRFTHAYVCSSLSSPSRYGVLTGRYAWRTRLEYGVLNNYSQPLIEPERTTIASLLKRHNYHTACVGKWHLGLDWALNESAPDDPVAQVFNSPKDNLQQYIDFSKPVEGGPVERGFDYFFGMAGSNNMQPWVYIENERVLQPPSEYQRPYDFIAEQVTRAPDWDMRTVNQVITQKAVEVINQHFAEDKGQPLFLYLPTSAIHRPCLPTFTRGQSQAGLRGDLVVELDWTVNEVIKALKVNGAYENTLLIFTSDNGPRPGDPALWIDRYKRESYEEYQDYFGDYAPQYINENGNAIWKNGWVTYDHPSSGPFRGFKQDPSEGGLRVPFLVHWPNRVPAAAVNEHVICATDILATLADLMGDCLAENEGEDSYSFLSNLLDGNAPQVRQTVTPAGGGSGALILIRDEWKYIEPALPGRWPETYYPDGPGDKVPRLFYLREDVAETTNLYNARPDQAAELVEEMARIRSHTQSEANPDSERKSNDRIIKH
jgi:arylsulfatase A-like enzyme